MDQEIVDLAHVEQLSDAQEKALAILPLPSAILSIVGSSVIIFIAFNSRSEQKWTPYTRLLIMMSATDMLFSATVGIGAFLRPSETSLRAWAFGSASTCSAVGFLNQLATSSVLYNAMLSAYFLLTARFNFRNSFIASSIEPWMHLVSLGYPLVTATVGAAVGEYGEMTVNGLVCWLVKFPANCGYGEGESGEECLSKFIGWVFYGLPVLITFVTINTNSVILTLFAQKQSDNLTNQSRRDQHRRLRLVRNQACLFFASFTICTLWTAILNSVEGTATTEEEELALVYRYFPVTVIQAIFMPLQGLLNMFVYIRPKYLKSRQEYPNESRFWAFQRSIFGDEIKPTQPSIPDAKVERVIPNKKMSDRQKNAMVGAFDSNEVEFYNDDDEFKTYSSCKKLSSKKVSEKTMSSLTTSSMSDFDDDDLNEDPAEEQWNTDNNVDHGSSSSTIIPEFRSSIVEWSDLEMINEDSESVFEPIRIPSLHSVSTSQQQSPSPLNLNNTEGRWNAGDSDASESIPPQTPPVIISNKNSSQQRKKNAEKIRKNKDGSERERKKDAHIMAPSRHLSDASELSADDAMRPSSSQDFPIRGPMRHLRNESVSLRDSTSTQALEPNPSVLQNDRLANDTPIRAPMRRMSDEALAFQPSSHEEPSSAVVANSPVAASRPTVLAVESPIILPSQRRSRSRLHGSAFFATTGRH